MLNLKLLPATLLLFYPLATSLTAPDLAPASWFLDEDEVMSAMGGSWNRTDKLQMSVWTSGNSAEPLVTGEKMFGQLLEDVLDTESGDFIYYTAWAIQPNMTLDPRGTIAPGINTTMTALWTEAIKRRVVTLTLVWRNVLNTEITRQWWDQMRAAAEAIGAGEDQARAIVDGRTKVGGSHHQKSLIIKRKGEAVAYLGGIDVTHDRWDTPEHCCAIPVRERSLECIETCKARETEPNNFRPGWEDVSVRLRGPAVLDVGANFISRWNDDEDPSSIPPYIEKAVKRKALPMDPSDTADSGVGTQAVQVLRTFACSYQPVCTKGCYSENAPDGDTTYLAALVKAIEKARNYLYLEDQYGLFQEDYHEAVDGALAAGLQYVVVLIQPPDPEADQFGYSSYQAMMWDPLKEKYPGRVFVYSRRDGTYVHSKIAVVDDTWMSIGSQNLNYRSLTSDTELAAAIVDEETIEGPDGFKVAKLALEFRTKLWAAALGVNAEDMKSYTLHEAVKLWQDDSRKERRVMPYAPIQKSPFGRITQRVVDGDGRCSGWIKDDEEEVAGVMGQGGFGGDISEISFL